MHQNTVQRSSLSTRNVQYWVIYPTDKNISSASCLGSQKAPRYSFKVKDVSRMKAFQSKFTNCQYQVLLGILVPSSLIYSLIVICRLEAVVCGSLQLSWGIGKEWARSMSCPNRFPDIHTQIKGAKTVLIGVLQAINYTLTKKLLYRCRFSIQNDMRRILHIQSEIFFQVYFHIER